jgi:hypothetical protein
LLEGEVDDCRRAAVCRRGRVLLSFRLHHAEVEPVVHVRVDAAREHEAAVHVDDGRGVAERARWAERGDLLVANRDVLDSRARGRHDGASSDEEVVHEPPFVAEWRS